MAVVRPRSRCGLMAVVVIGIVLPIVFLALLSVWSKRPSNLGITAGQLAPCPQSPNCVSTFADDPPHAMAPIPFSCTADRALAALQSVVRESPGAKIVAVDGNYLHAEFKSRLFRFVDDVEFLVDDQNQLVHFRSASRTGYSDFGVNRNRLEKLRGLFEQKTREPAAEGGS